MSVYNGYHSIFSYPRLLFWDCPLFLHGISISFWPVLILIFDKLDEVLKPDLEQKLTRTLFRPPYALDKPKSFDILMLKVIHFCLFLLALLTTVEIDC